MITHGLGLRSDLVARGLNPGVAFAFDSVGAGRVRAYLSIGGVTTSELVASNEIAAWLARGGFAVSTLVLDPTTGIVRSGGVVVGVLSGRPAFDAFLAAGGASRSVDAVGGVDSTTERVGGSAIGIERIGGVVDPRYARGGKS